jgi:MFS family permease
MYFQTAQGLSATRAGAAVMPGTLVLAFSYPVAGVLLDWFSPRQVMAGGMVIFVASWSVLGGLVEHLSYAGFVIVLVISRIGYGFSNTPLNQAALAGLNGAALGQASAMIGYVRQLGGVFGVAALAAFVEWRTVQLGGGRAAQLDAYAEAFLLVALLSALSLAAIWNMRGQRAANDLANS